MAGRTAVLHVLMRSGFKDVPVFVAMHAKILGLCDEQILVPGAVRIVAHRATARGYRSMNDPFLDLEVMAVETKVFLCHKQFVRLALVTALAESCRIGAVLLIRKRYFHSVPV
jgi:hypothetical protein